MTKTILHPDIIVAFFTFMSVRYYLPNIILNKSTSMWDAFVLSFCYGLTVYIRSHSQLLAEYLPNII